MRLLNGSELAGFIKERQARQVRALRQADHVFPMLAILKNPGNPLIDTFVRLKQAYGDDILIGTQVEDLAVDDMARRIEELNADDAVHGIIVQLPLDDAAQTDAIVSRIAPEKDVDGLGGSGIFTSATATAIDWLLAGYNVDLRGKKITIVGNGRLVGAPLSKLWQGNGLLVEVLDIAVSDLTTSLRDSEIIVSATGVPGLITGAMIQKGAVVVDAGTTSENGQIVGDVAPAARERDDLTITPVRGGVGPLTIAVLFDNVIKAATSMTAHVQ